MFCIRSKEIIGCIQIIPSLIQIRRYHWLISRCRKIVYEEIPSVFLTMVFERCWSFYGSESALSDMTLDSCPLCRIIIPPVFRSCHFHDDLLTVTLGDMVSLISILDNVCIDPSGTSTFQEFSTIFPGFLCEVGCCTPHNILSAVTGCLCFVCVALRSPVYNECALSFSVIIVYPCSLRCPHHTKVILFFSFGIQVDIKLAYITPCDQVFGFPYIHLSAVIGCPGSPSGIVCPEYSQVRCNDVISLRLRIVSQERIPASCCSKIGSQDWISSVQRIPLFRIISSGNVQIHFFCISFRIFYEMNHQISVFIIFTDNCFHRYRNFYFFALSGQCDHGCQSSLYCFFTNCRLFYRCSQSVFCNDNFRHRRFPCYHSIVIRKHFLAVR